MCGIIGFNGNQSARQHVLRSLKKIEYRGYDSAGIAIMTENGIDTAKTTGGVDELTIVSKPLKRGVVAIGHTRWATHGEPSKRNAHPHTSGRFSLVHNGIIENHGALRDLLTKEGYSDFSSETDTEVLLHLIERNMDIAKEPEAAIASSLRMVEGTFGVAILHSDTPNMLYVARRSSPIIIAKTKLGYIAASDASALPKHTEHVTYLEDDQIAAISQNELRIFDLQQKTVDYGIEPLEAELLSVNKGGKSHYMLKEILEQPTSVAETMRGRFDEHERTAILGGLNMTEKEAAQLTNLFAVACGTAHYSSILASYLLESIVDLSISYETASEYLYRKRPINPKNTMSLAISQSGETADTIAAVNKLNMLGVRTYGIVNVVGSNVARITDGGTYLRCGPEIAVASTKAFTSQVVAQLLLGLRLNWLRGEPIKGNHKVVEHLQKLPKDLRSTISATEDSAHSVAKRIAKHDKIIFLGRNSLYPVALEGALKFKEITYTPTEAHPAGEMKHGPLALIDESMLVVFLIRKDELYEKSISNLHEIDARHGQVLVITDSKELAAERDLSILLPPTNATNAPLTFNIPLQFLAYYTALEKKLNIDKPRNLAKSVTVE